MPRMSVRSTLVATLFCAVIGIVPSASAQVSLTGLGTPYTQNFNGLATTGTANTWTDNTTLPGWYAQFSATPANPTTYRADSGGSNTGAIYSWGVAGVNALTERAFGSLSSGTPVTVLTAVRFVNNTGAAISSLDVSYMAEQWRDGGAATPVAQTTFFEYQVANAGTITDANTPSAGWTSVASLNMTTPTFTNTGAGAALEGNQPANRVAKSATITVAVNPGQEIWFRWRDINDGGNDHGLAVDDISVTPQGASPNAPVVPTCPASVSTTFGSATTAPVSASDTDGTVTSAAITGITPSDPGTITLTGFTPAGGVGGTANATLDVSNTTPVGNYSVTIQWSNNDGTPQTANCVVAVNVTAPVVIVPIHDIQGNGSASPLAGQTVSARGIVTLLKSNGFFLQEELADYDADPNTSEGIFVFTSSAPTVAVGDDATVTGTAVEFNGLTEISPVTNVTVNSSGNTLPTAIALLPADLPAAGSVTQPLLEKYECMRLLAASLTTVAPNDNFFDVETVLTTEPRPMREPGIPVSDPIPPDPTSGLPDPNIPIWDENPERLAVDTNGRAGSTGETLTSNVTLTSVAGPLDFAFGRYRLINEVNLTRTADMSAAAVPTPAADQFTVAGYNIENFNNNATQRQKAALTIRDVLLLPDIIGTVEIFDLADLQALATELQSIAGVTYSAHLIEQDGTSEDSDQDLGFLIKTSRVSVTSVTQERAADTYINPNTSLPETLHDRPPLVLRGTVDPSGPGPLPVIVVVNHTRSFIDVDLVAGEGVRVRAKRKAQAESIADLLNDLQTDNPGVPVIAVGDYNAFQFNCGYDDTISVMKGMPTPDDQIVVDQSPDLVNPNYSNLMDSVPAAQRYSFMFEGTPQVLDHFLINGAAAAINTGIAVARVNSDYPSIPAAAYASNAARPEGNSDHDPVVGYFVIPNAADVSLTKTLDTAGPYFETQSVTYTINVANAGPDPATNIQVTDTPTNLSITGVSGACVALPCTIASLAAGANTNITVTATIVAAGAFDNSATATPAETDPISANNTDNTGNGGTAGASADVSVTKTLDTAGPYYIGNSVTYTITVANAGPSTATNIGVTDTPTNLTITGVSGACTSFSPCTIASLASGANTAITVTATINAAGAFDNSATATGAENDPNTGNNTSNDGDTALAQADVSLTKTLDTAGPYTNGMSVTYTITVSNAGPSTATNIGVTDTPTNLTITGVSGACTSFSPCTIASLGSGASTNITVTATINAVGAFDNSATATAAENDPNSANNTDNTGNGGSASDANDVTATKTVSGTFVQGTNITYTIVITNNMSITQPDNFQHEFTDILPAGLTYVSSTATSGTAALVVAPDTFAWNGSIPPGGTVTVTITCTINPTASGTISNQGQTIFDTDNDNSNDSSHLTDDPSTAAVDDPTVFTVIAANNYTATKSASGTFVAGSNVTYTVALANGLGFTLADNAGNEFTDVLPPSLTLVSASASGGTAVANVGTNTVTWNGSIAASSSVTITIVATISPSATGTVSNQGSTSTDLDNNGTNEASGVTDDPSTGTANDPTVFTVVPPAGLVTASKTASGTFVPGSNVTYTIILTNNMGITMLDNPGDELTDVLPASLTLISANATAGTATATIGTNTVTWNGSLAAGASTTITITAAINVTASGTVSNQASFVFDADGNGTSEQSGLSDDPSTGTANDPTTFTVAAPSADLSVTKTDSPDPVTAGTNLTYTITVINSGPSNASTVTLSDTLPAGTTFVSLTAPGGWSCTTPAVGGTGAVSCTNPSLAVGNAIFTLVVAVDSSLSNGTVITNAAVVSSTTSDPNTGNETGTATTTVGVGSADLSVTKTDSPDPVNAGGSLTYTITVNNAGPTNASTVSLSDPLPPNTTFVSLASAAGWTCTTPAVGATGTVTCTNASLAVGSSVFTLTVAVDAATAANTILSNTATVTSATTDPTPGNESATETTSVRSPATLSATKTASGTFEPSSTVTYTIVISNSGPSAQGDNPGDEMVDVLPAQLILVSATATSGTALANTGTNTVTWNGSIAAGGSVTVTITATIASSAIPGSTITNQATISYDADGNGTNEATAQSDNPATGGADATGFVVAAPASHVAIPTLDEWTLLALAAMLAVIAIMVMKKA